MELNKLNLKKLGLLSILVASLVFISFIIFSRTSGDILKKIDFSQAYTDRDGNLLRVFLSSDEKYRIFCKITTISPKLKQAILLQEDKYFYIHPGFNPASLFRAFNETYIKKTRRVGASTITMQVVRLLYKFDTRTISGKLKQIALALWLELRYSKDNIFQAYLNLAPMGGNIEGFQAGSYYYFNTDVQNLTLSQALFLAIIPQNPVVRGSSSLELLEQSLEARKILFDAWQKKHPKDSNKFSDLELPFFSSHSFPFKAIHFTERAKKEDPNSYKGSRSSGIKKTSLNPVYQNLAEQELTSWIRKNSNIGVNNGAVLIANRNNMEILASIGSANWYSDEIFGQVDGTTSKRSPGSTLKPFIYALAIDEGIIHSKTMIKDVPTGFNEYTPDNYKSDFVGPVFVDRALVDSRNIPAVFLQNQLLQTPQNLYTVLKKSNIKGLKNYDHYGLSMVLGSAEITMNELIELYGALANSGNFNPTSIFLTEKKQKKSEKLFSSEAAYIILRTLEIHSKNLVRSQTTKDVPLAYKTGTSIGFKDAWAVGISGPFIICVWIGNFDGQGNTAFVGRPMSVPLLVSLFDALLSTLEKKDRYHFEPYPQNLELVKVCSVSGSIPTENCPQTTLAWYIPGVSPITNCQIHRKVFIDNTTGYRTNQQWGENIRSEVREFWQSDLLALFEEAGLPRLLPPPYAPSDKSIRASNFGFPPEIKSPLNKTTYVLQEEQNRKEIVLQAATDADSSYVNWFANSLFLCKTEANKLYLWQAIPGEYTITAVDEKGKSSSVFIVVN